MTTEQRTGFRLPWSGAPQQSDEAAEAVVDAAPATEPQSEAVVDATPATEPQIEPWTASDPVDGPTTASEGTAMTDEPTTTTSGPRRPARFLADLLRAMQAAAGESRAATIESFRAEVSQFVEGLHARSAELANGLRDAAEADVAGVREWSKAEIARIRAETEERIAARRAELEQQLEAHAAAVEAEIERLHGAVSSFEQEMDSFFEQLNAIDDPTVFAATAERLPEPPSLESTVTLMAPVAPPATEPAEQAVESMREATATADETWPEAIVASESWPETDAPAETATPSEAAWPTTDVAPEQPTEEAAATMGTAEAVQVEAEVAQAADAEATGEVAQDAMADDNAESMADDPAAAAALESRLASLGLAEPAAFSEVVTDAASDEPSTASEPAPESMRPADLVDTEVVVVGLVSVASIASFKRQLARLPGVDSVSVTSGAEGEFVFRTSHEAALALHETVPTMPGFGARVIEAGPGRIQVSARDPEADS